MRKAWTGLFTRLLVTLFAGVLLVAPAIGVAHAAEHHGAVDSVDCGTCHWSKNAAVALSVAPTLGCVTTVEVVRAAAPAQPSLPLELSEQHPRGPPAARV